MNKLIQLTHEFRDAYKDRLAAEGIQFVLILVDAEDETKPEVSAQLISNAAYEVAAEHCRKAAQQLDITARQLAIAQGMN